MSEEEPKGPKGKLAKKVFLDKMKGTIDLDSIERAFIYDALSEMDDIMLQELQKQEKGSDDERE